MRVLVTGPTGFVGRTLLGQLRQHDVRIAVRGNNGVELAREASSVGEINGSTEWGRALADVDCVVHLAARVHVMNPSDADRAQFRETNVDGTERLANCAAEAGVKRFIFLSSIKVNGEFTLMRAFKHDDFPNPRDDYGVSKMEAEKRLFAVAERTQMRAVAIRSPLVYGPGVKANFLNLMSWVYRGIPLPLGMVHNRRSLISVWNLCDLIQCLVTAPNIVSGVVMASDDEDLSTPELVHRLSAAMRRKSRVFPVPVQVLRWLGTAAGASGMVQRLTSSLVVDLSETKRQLAWKPCMSVNEGLSRTAEWFLRQRGDGFA